MNCTYQGLHLYDNAKAACDYLKNCNYEYDYFNLLTFNYCIAGNRQYITWPLIIIVFRLCFYFLSTSVDEYVSGIVGRISVKLNMSQNLAGLTLLAFGNQVADITVAIVSGGEEEEGIEASLSTILGADSLVIGFVMPTVIFLGNGVIVKGQNFTRDLLTYLIALILIFSIGIFSRKIGLVYGLIIFGLYIVYVGLCIIMEKIENRKNKNDKKKERNENESVGQDSHFNFKVKLFEDDEEKQNEEKKDKDEKDEKDENDSIEEVEDEDEVEDDNKKDEENKKENENNKNEDENVNDNNEENNYKNNENEENNKENEENNNKNNEDEEKNKENNNDSEVSNKENKNEENKNEENKDETMKIEKEKKKKKIKKRKIKEKNKDENKEEEKKDTNKNDKKDDPDNIDILSDKMSLIEDIASLGGQEIFNIKNFINDTYYLKKSHESGQIQRKTNIAKDEKHLVYNRLHYTLAKYYLNTKEEKWSEISFLKKIIKIFVEFPLNLIRDLTTPPFEKEKWKKEFFALMPVSISLCLSLFFNLFKYYIKFPHFIFIAVYYLLALFLCYRLYKITYRGSLPNCEWALLISALIMSMIWIFTVTKILVQMINDSQYLLPFEVSRSFLIMTVLAVGNALPDFLIDCTLSRSGYAEMALSGTIGSPVFSLLFGFGLSLIKTFSLSDIKQQKFDLLTFTPSTKVILCAMAGIFINLVHYMLIFSLVNYKVQRYVSYAGFCVFFGYLLSLCLVSFVFN